MMSGGLCVTVEAMGCQEVYVLPWRRWDVRRSVSYRGGHGMSGGLCLTVEAMGCQEVYVLPWRPWDVRRCMSYRGGHGMSGGVCLTVEAMSQGKRRSEMKARAAAMPTVSSPDDVLLPYMNTLCFRLWPCRSQYSMI